jgi:hypothetical protein
MGHCQQRQDEHHRDPTRRNQGMKRMLALKLVCVLVHHFCSFQGIARGHFQKIDQPVFTSNKCVFQFHHFISDAVK